MEQRDYSKQIFYILLFFVFIVSGVILNLSSSFVIPVTVSVLLSCVFYPIVKKINEKTKLPWVLGTLLFALLFLIAMLLIITIVGTSVTTILGQYSKYESRFLSIYKVVADTFRISFDNEKNLFDNLWDQLKVREFVQRNAITFSGDILSSSKNIGLVLLFSIFLLIEMKNGRERINSLSEGKLSDRIQKIVHKVISETVHYISIKFFISLATGILVLLLLLPLRLDFAIMWAFLAFIMNFIPTFGSIISVGLTTLFAILQFYPTAFPIIFIFTGMTLINIVLGNIIEPKIEGENLGLSPFVILVSLTFWGWMWGFIGLILAVPVMVIVKIICENISYLNGIATLIGNKPKVKNENMPEEA